MFERSYLWCFGKTWRQLELHSGERAATRTSRTNRKFPQAERGGCSQFLIGALRGQGSNTNFVNQCVGILVLLDMLKEGCRNTLCLTGSLALGASAMMLIAKGGSSMRRTFPARKCRGQKRILPINHKLLKLLFKNGNNFEFRSALAKSNMGFLIPPRRQPRSVRTVLQVLRYSLTHRCH